MTGVRKREELNQQVKCYFTFSCSNENVAGGARGPRCPAAVPAAAHDGACRGLPPCVRWRAVHVQRDTALGLPASGECARRVLLGVVWVMMLSL